MTYLSLFLTFLKIGAVSFGGGYGMISLLKEEVLSHGWLTEPELLNFIAVSESTPGPIAVNMATFVGSSQGGILGSFLATLGVILPAFVIILLIAALLQNLMKYAGVEAFLTGVRPCVAGLITATALTMILSALFGVSSLSAGFAGIDLRAILLFAIIAAGAFVFKKIRKSSPSPILLIAVSALLGILFYGVIPC